MSRRKGPPSAVQLSIKEKRRVELAHDVHRAAALLSAYAPSSFEALRVARVLHGLVDDLLPTDDGPRSELSVPGQK